MRNRMAWSAGIAAILVLSGWWFWEYRTGAEQGAGDYQLVEAARRDMGASVLATGVIKPMVGAEVRVGSRASGMVHRLRANIGDRVQKGDVLAE